MSNALLMSSATLIVRSGALFWMKPVAMVLCMLCSVVPVEWVAFEAMLCGRLFVMHGSSILIQCFAIPERSEMGLS